MTYDINRGTGKNEKGEKMLNLKGSRTTEKTSTRGIRITT